MSSSYVEGSVVIHPEVQKHIPAIQALCEEARVTRLELCEGHEAVPAGEKTPTCFIVTIPDDGDAGVWAGRLTELETRLAALLDLEIDLLLPGSLRNDWVREHIARRRVELYSRGQTGSWTRNHGS